MHISLGDVAKLVGGRLAGRADVAVRGIASPHLAGPEDLTLVTKVSNLARLAQSRAGSAIVPEGCEVPGKDVVHHANPYAALAAVIERLHPAEPLVPAVSDLAVVDPTARLGRGVRVEPLAVIERGAEIGDRVHVGAGCYVGPGVRNGEGTVLHARVVLYARTVVGKDCLFHSGVVLGADGFGFTRESGRHRKIPQIGGVVVGDDVEIGANSCIDSGTLEPTRIGTNTKIDNLVQVGHNCEIGERVVLCGSVAIAGSTTVEDDVVFGGRSGAADHLRIGRGAMIAAGSGVIADVAAGAQVAGLPEMPIEDWRKSAAALRHLPDFRSEIRDEIRKFRRRLDELERTAVSREPGGEPSLE